MAVFTCNQCGAPLDFTPGSTVVKCAYCDVMQTVPLFESETHIDMYRRAQQARCNQEFDRAMSLCDMLINDDAADSDAYWQLVLSRYGVVYVKDAVTGRMIPTVNRSSYTLLSDDSDYKNAVACADESRREIYERDAKEIDGILREIIAISRSEAPYDVFICYKESDENGGQTEDSALAHKLYNELTRDGFKVFFARITLAKALGRNYEPYIFAALHSAKVMIALCTSKGHINAPWVKNEWSRYLALIRAGEKKTLIPAYKYITPQELPPEMRMLQAQDMEKLAWELDMCDAVKKLLGVKKASAVSNADKLAEQLKRAKLALEDKDWKRADEFYEAALNCDAECAEAYLGKYLAAAKYSDSLDGLVEHIISYTEKAEPSLRSISKKEEILDKYSCGDLLPRPQLENLFGNAQLSFQSAVPKRQQQYKRLMDISVNDPLINKAKRFSSGRLQEEITAAIEKIRSTAERRLEEARSADVDIEREITEKNASLLRSVENEAERRYNAAIAKTEKQYSRLKSELSRAKHHTEFDNLQKQFRSIDFYKDCSRLAEECAVRSSEASTREEGARLEAQERERRAAPVHRAIRVITCIASLVIFAITAFIYYNNFYVIGSKDILAEKDDFLAIFIYQLIPAAFAIYIMPFFDVKKLVVDSGYTKLMLIMSAIGAAGFSTLDVVFNSGLTDNAAGTGMEALNIIATIAVLILIRMIATLIITIPKFLFHAIVDRFF